MFHTRREKDADMNACKKEKTIFISVVRDFDLYDRIVRNNPWNRDAGFMYFDNREENIGIPERYNSFLDTYDYDTPAWFIFCHEDWEAKEDMSSKVTGLPRTYLYGPIGARLLKAGKKYHRFNIGRCEQSERDGSRHKIEQGIFRQGPADTFDCQCLIVHSSLIRKYGLRFDDRLTFDLYVEDFCINAREKFGIQSIVLKIKCQHYSYGNITERFMRLKDYVGSKYSGIYTTIAGGCIIGNAEGKNISEFRKSPFNHPEKYLILLMSYRYLTHWPR